MKERPDLRDMANGTGLQKMGEGAGSSEGSHQMALKCQGNGGNINRNRQVMTGFFFLERCVCVCTFEIDFWETGCL